MKNQRGLQGAKRLFFVQISVALITASISSVVFGFKVGYSLAVGVVVWLIPQLFFAKVLFQDQRARFAKQAMQRVYRAEAIKLVLTTGLFATVFAWLVVVPKAFFMGYLMAFGLSWLAPWCFKYEKNRWA